MDIHSIAFLLLAFITCVAAIGMLWTKNILHAVLCMFFVMFGLAGLYVLAEADVLAVSHLLIYVGGVMILLLFGIMLSQQREVANDKKNQVFTKENPIFWPILITLLVFLGWLKMIQLANLGTQALNEQTSSQIKDVGFLFLTQYAFPFELVGLFLLIALVGSTYIAKKND